MRAIQHFRQDTQGNVFAYLAMTAAAVALLCAAYIWLSTPDITALVADVTPGPAVLAKGSDGMTEGIAVPDKPATVFFIRDEKP